MSKHILLLAYMKVDKLRYIFIINEPHKICIDKLYKLIKRHISVAIILRD